MRSDTGSVEVGDEEERRKKRIVLALILASWATYLIVAITAVFYSDLRLVAATLVGSALQLVPLWLLRRGRLRASSLLIVLSALGTVTIIAMIGQGIRDLAIVAFPVVFVFASLTLNRALFGLSVGVTLAAVGWLVFGEANGWFVTQPFYAGLPNWVDFTIVAAILLVAALSVDLLATNMRRSLERARQEIAQRKQVEEDLRERVKELRCLYSITNVIARTESMDEILRGSAEAMPNGWFYPDIACARICFQGRSYQTGNFRETAWRQAADLMVMGQLVGAVELYYLEERPPRDEGPFLSDERRLIEAIAERLGRLAERQQAEAALRASEARLRAILNASPDDITLTDLDGRILGASVSAATMFGYQREEELLGRLRSDFIVPEDRERAASSVALLHEGITPGPGEYRGLRKDGSTFDLEMNEEFLQGADGQAMGIVFVIRDITRRKQAEQALRESEEKHRLLIENSHDIIYTLSLNGTLTFVSPAWTALLGHPVAQVTGRPFRELVHPDDVAGIVAFSRRIIGDRAATRGTGVPCAARRRVLALAHRERGSIAR